METKILSEINEHLKDIHEFSFEVSLNTLKINDIVDLTKLIQDDSAESTIQLLNMSNDKIKEKVQKEEPKKAELESNNRLVSTIKELGSKFDNTFSAKALQKNLVDKLKKSSSGMLSMLKPGNMVKMLGLSMNSPLVMMLGDKLSDLQDTVKDSWKSNKQDKPKEDFTKEQTDEKSLALQERTTEALEEMASKKDPKEQKEGGFFGWLMNLFGLGSLAVVLGKFKAFRKSFFSFGKGMGLFGKTFKLFSKIIGKVIFPIMAAYEIIKSFINEDTIKDKIIGAAAGVFSLIAEIPEWIINGLLSLFGSGFKVDFSKEKIQKFFNGIVEKFKEPILSFFDSIPTKVRAALDFAKDLPNLIVTKFNKFLDIFRIDIPNFIGSMVDNITSWISNLKEASPVEMLSMISNLMTFIPRKIISSLWNIFENILPDVANSMGTQLQSIKEGLMNFAKNMLFSVIPDRALNFLGIERPKAAVQIQTKSKINAKELQSYQIDYSNKKELDKAGNTNLMSNTNNNYIAPPDMSVSSDDASLFAAMGIGA